MVHRHREMEDHLFPLSAWVILLFLGMMLMGGTSTAIAIRGRKCQDDGSLEFQDCTVEVQQERRNNRALLFMGLLGFWLVVLSFVIR